MNQTQQYYEWSCVPFRLRHMLTYFGYPHAYKLAWGVRRLWLLFG